AKDRRSIPPSSMSWARSFTSAPKRFTLTTTCSSAKTWKNGTRFSAREKRRNGSVARSLAAHQAKTLGWLPECDAYGVAMPWNQLCLRMMLWSLGVSAAVGVGAIFASDSDIMFRLLWTSLATALASGLMWPLTMLADKPSPRLAGFVGMAAVLV